MSWVDDDTPLDVSSVFRTLVSAHFNKSWAPIEAPAALPPLLKPPARYVRDRDTGLWTRPRYEEAREDFTSAQLAQAVADFVEGVYGSGVDVRVSHGQSQVATRVDVTVYEDGPPETAMGELERVLAR